VVYLSTSGCLAMAPIARLAGVRHRIVHIQERWSGREASVLRALTRFTTCRIAISEAVAEASRVERPAPVIVTNCVDDPLHGSTPTPTGDSEPLTYVVASRWNRWKGHTTLLEAWGRAGCPGRLVVLGGPPPVGDAVDVRALATALDRPETVEIVGEVADAPAHIATADVLVLPSDDPEPFGLVVIEAFAVGRPVIASRAGGPLEVVEDGRTGWFFEPRDADDLARVLRSLTPPQVAAAGRAARADYVRRFHPAAYRERIAAVLGDELSSR
jgi:glycosyltransferase involved in cell wall biosynthesis